MVAFNMQDAIPQNYTSVAQQVTNVSDASVVPRELMEKKNKLYDDLAEVMLQGIINESISSELSHEITITILKKLDSVKSRDELLEFLHNLATKWSAYNPFYVKLKYEDEQKKDDQKMKDIQSKLKLFMKNTYVSRATNA